MSAEPAPRENLLAAARRVLERTGLEGLTLRAIAREAGVSHSAPLRHYSGLAPLLSSLSARGFDELTAETDRLVAEAPHDPAARLTQSGVAYIRFATSNPGMFALMFRPELLDLTDADYQAAAARSFGRLLDLVLAAQEDGAQPDRPSDQLAALLWSQVHGLAQLWVQGALQAVVDVEGVDDLVELFTRWSTGR